MNVSTVVKIWYKCWNASNGVVGPVAKASTIILNQVAVDCKVTFNCVKDELNRSINWVIWGPEYNSVTICMYQS